ncbi:hypothetical protein C4580_03585 [Candidatus Woesearchaeota archaeon]|nr:MAG: hypothetical protein C4580_03585 [Candidatus Woesearchaeota archaeon]
MRNFWDKWNRYGWFSHAEFIAFGIVSVALGMVLSWSLWGYEEFDVLTGLGNWLYWSVLAGVVVFVHHAGQRAWGLVTGFKLEHKVYVNGLVLSLLLMMLSQGRLKLLAVTSAEEKLVPIHRLGAFRHGENVATIAQITMAGPVACVVFAAVMGALGSAGVLGVSVAKDVFWLALSFAAWNVLPVPGLDGAKIVYWNRFLYVWFVCSLAAYWFVAGALGIFGLGFPLAVVVGLGLTFLFVKVLAKGLF